VPSYRGSVGHAVLGSKGACETTVLPPTHWLPVCCTHPTYPGTVVGSMRAGQVLPGLQIATPVATVTFGTLDKVTARAASAMPFQRECKRVAMMAELRHIRSPIAGLRELWAGNNPLHEQCSFTPAGLLSGKTEIYQTSFANTHG
jgi:hypothetical protein